MDKKILKNEKGSITLFVLLSCLFFLAIVTSVGVYLRNKETAVEQQYQQIKQSYEQDVGKEEEIWKNEEYNITYNLDGGTVSGNPTTYTAKTETIVLNEPTKAGYKFTGWTEGQDKIGTIIAQESNFTINGTEMTMENITSGNVFRGGIKLQIANESKQYLDQLEMSTESVSKTYTHNRDTGNYYMRFGANGSTRDCLILFPIYLENGKEYQFEWETKEFTSTRAVIDNLKFYRKGGVEIGIPNNIITKGSIGNRIYTANWEVIN